MKKILMLATAVAFGALMAQPVGITPAFADDQAAAAPAANGPDGSAADAQKGERFDKMKSKIQQKLQEREDKLNTIKSCVDGATTPDALRACLPKREGRGGHGGWKRGEGGGGFMRHNQGGDDNGAPPQDGGQQMQDDGGND